MRKTAVPASTLVFAVVISSLSGCTPVVPASRLYSAQRQSQQLYGMKQAVMAERDSAIQLATTTATDRDRFASEVAQTQSQLAQSQEQLAVADHRLKNLLAERGKLQSRYVSLLNRHAGSPLDAEATRRFEELARRYPDLEFDPHTGVSKFHADILFASGSDQLRNEASPLLAEIAEILNIGESERLKLLVCGHTDDKAISHRVASKHPTNWHLSTNRANAVVVSLARYGIRPERIGAMGYSKYQPIVPNSDDRARQHNRRVEIFVLAPDALIANWEPAVSRN